VANVLLTPQVITNELLRRFENNLGFAKVAHHEDYREHFANKGAKIGDTLNLRVPVKFLATDGAVLVIQDVTENKVPLVVDTQKHTGFSFTSREETLTIDRFGDRYVNSAAVALANAAEIHGLNVCYRATPNSVGTPATPPQSTTAFAVYLSALEALDNNAAPVDDEVYMVITPNMNTYIIDALKGLFQSSAQISEQYIKGYMGKGAGFTWLRAQNLRTHTLGAFPAAPLVNGAGQLGASLNLKACGTSATGIFKAGDIIVLGASGTLVHAVNPVSGDALAGGRQFVVTADVNSDGSALAVVPIYPSIITSGPYKTCDASPGDGVQVYPFGTASYVSPQGMSFHREAYAWACVPLDLPKAVEWKARQTDPDTGISIRCVSQYDIVNDVFATRCDIMFGWVAPRPEWGCRVCS
jgi:hypothetical protein